MTQHEKKQLCKNILNAYNINSKLDELDSAIMLNYFENHPNWHNKKGTGIKYIFIMPTNYGRCFGIMRADNTDIDISYEKSIKSYNPINDIYKAGRIAIQQIIKDYKNNNVIFGETKCAVSNEILYADNTHIDHYDATFIVMINSWIEKYGKDFVLSKLDHTGKGITFIDKELENDFIRYHNTHCKLRAVTAKANNTICKNDDKTKQSQV